MNANGHPVRQLKNLFKISLNHSMDGKSYYFYVRKYFLRVTIYCNNRCEQATREADVRKIWIF